jgi:hypothetical protein
MRVETDNEVALRFLLDSYEQVKDEPIITRFRETIENIVDSVFLEVLYDDERKEMLSKSLAVMLSLSMYLRDNPDGLEKKVH